MLRFVFPLLALVVVACGATASGSRPPPPAADETADEAAADAVQRFDVPVGDETFYAEVLAIEVLPADGSDRRPSARAQIRLCRADGTDAAKALGGDGPPPAWSGVVPSEGVEVEFANVMTAPGVPAPLNAVRMQVGVSVDDENRPTFSLSSQAMCVR